jgi:hypothetical protein
MRPASDDTHAYQRGEIFKYALATSKCNAFIIGNISKPIHGKQCEDSMVVDAYFSALLLNNSDDPAPPHPFLTAVIILESNLWMANSGDVVTAIVEAKRKRVGGGGGGQGP